MRSEVPRGDNGKQSLVQLSKPSFLMDMKQTDELANDFQGSNGLISEAKHEALLRPTFSKKKQRSPKYLMKLDSKVGLSRLRKAKCTNTETNISLCLRILYESHGQKAQER